MRSTAAVAARPLFGRRAAHRFPTAAILLLLCPVSLPAAAVPDKVDFNHHLRPIFSDRCFACHGHDEKGRQAKLRLDTEDGGFLDGHYHSLLARTRWPRTTYPGIIQRLTNLRLLDDTITVNVNPLPSALFKWHKKENAF